MKRNREFVMLCESLKLSEANGFSLGNWFVSEKLDGMRALWLPDTVGLRVNTLPFANLDKDVTQAGLRVATGLWSRYAKPIWAPPSFTDQLPRHCFLDGELWTGRGEFQRLTSIVKQGTPGPEWKHVQYRVFDAPSPDVIYRDGKIHNGTLKKDLKGIWPWVQKELSYDYKVPGMVHLDTFERTWHTVLRPLVSLARDAESNLVVHDQEQLSWRHADAVERLRVLLDSVLEAGGEGLVVRAPHATWDPVRSKLCLKVKPENEFEGRVVGYNPGTVGGRLEGMLGSLQIEGQSPDPRHGVVTFGLSGLSDKQRRLDVDGPTGNPESLLFPIGTVITYLYRDITDEGIPREARFLRVRPDE